MLRVERLTVPEKFQTLLQLDVNEIGPFGFVEETFGNELDSKEMLAFTVACVAVAVRDLLR